MPNPRLAGRYAKSLLDLAVEKNVLDSVYQDMLYLEQVCKLSREFVVLLKSPVVKSDKKEKILAALAKDRISTLTATFNQLLIRKGREFYLPEVVEAFIKQYKAYKGIHVVRLTTAVEVGEDVKAAIIEKITSISAIKHVELNTAVNPDLIGGFVLEVGDKLVDSSVPFDLRNIKMQFEKNDFIYRIR